jgi:hypothetical protein
MPAIRAYRRRRVHAVPPAVLEASDATLRARREEILRDLGVSYEELRERATAYRLAGEEWDAWDEVSEIDYLLDER